MKEISVDEYFARDDKSEKVTQKNLPRILLNGSCNLESITQILKAVGEVHLETNCTDEKGIAVISQSHSVHILESYTLNKNEMEVKIILATVANMFTGQYSIR